MAKVDGRDVLSLLFQALVVAFLAGICGFWFS